MTVGEVYAFDLREVYTSSRVDPKSTPSRLTSGAGRVDGIELSSDGMHALLVANFSEFRPITTRRAIWGAALLETLSISSCEWSLVPGQTTGCIVNFGWAGGRWAWACSVEGSTLAGYKLELVGDSNHRRVLGAPQPLNSPSTSRHLGLSPLCTPAIDESGASQLCVEGPDDFVHFYDGVQCAHAGFEPEHRFGCG